MDPHSTLSQFNQRHPKLGPKARSQDAMTNLKRAEKRPKLQSYNTSPAPSERPIATNSRIKQDEKYRRDMYLVFVNDALQKKSKGIAEPFDELVSQFNIKRASDDESASSLQPAQLRLWFSALTHVVSRLEHTHVALVQAIVNMPWTTLDSATVKTYTVFLGNLLSAHPEYLSLVLGKIAQGFTHQSGLQALHNVGAEASSSPLTRRVIYDRLHDLLQHLLSLIPTLPTTLLPLLIRHFPHKRQDQIAQTTYIRNLLRLSSYCPEVADTVLSTIIDRAIQIDVEIQVELEDLEENENDQQEELFEIDPFDTVVNQENDLSSDSGSEAGDFSDLSSGGEDDEVGSESRTNLSHIQDMVQKLDIILSLIFEHFSRIHSATTAESSSLATSPNSRISSPDLAELSPLPSSLPLTPIQTLASTRSSVTDTFSKRHVDLAPSERLRSQFHTLLSIFDRTILRTFKSRYTQFLMFWFTSLDPEFADVFQGMLVDRALFASELHPPINGAADVPTATVTRAAAASYIGSFVSRATFVDRATTRMVVGVLCQFLRAHLDTVDEAVRTFGLGSVLGFSNVVGRAQNTVFYAVAQAVFLIFCFRWGDLLEEEDVDDDGDTWKGAASLSAAMSGKKWIPELGVLQRVVTSVLNPLKVCSSNVVAQFARVARATDFVYCYSILQSNKRSEVFSKSSNDARPSSTAGSSMTHSALFFGDTNAAELNTFFPFDPCRLERSSSYLQGIYREWSSVAVNDDEEEDEEEDVGDDEVTQDGGVMLNSKLDDSQFMGGGVDGGNATSSIPISGRATAADQIADGLGASLETMSISPAQSGIRR